MLKILDKSSNVEKQADVLSATFFQNTIVSEWLTSAQVASYLRISENALRIMVYRRQIKFEKVGRRLRFHVTEVSRLLPMMGASR